MAQAMESAEKPYSLSIKVRNIAFFDNIGSTSKSDMTRLFHALLVSSSDKFIDLYSHPELKSHLETLHRYSTEIVNLLASSRRAELYDVIDAANYAAHLHAKTGRLESPSAIVNAVLDGNSPGIDRVQRPRIEYTETEAQRAKRVARETEDCQKRRESAAAKGRTCILMPIFEERTYKIHNASVDITINELPPNFETAYRLSDDRKSGTLASLNDFLRSYHPASVAGPVASAG